MKHIFALAALLLLLPACDGCGDKKSGAKPAKPTDPKVEKVMKELDLQPADKLFAIFKTNKGEMIAELFWDKAPATVENFVGLSKGTTEWTDPKTGKKVTDKPLYSGTIFHRVIPDFMIQGGDPMGNGMGGPGYRFEDEFHPELRHNGPGVLSMANSGPNTNGSQFFITEGPTPHLDNRHSVFGKVVKNLDVVETIAKAERDRRDKPLQDVILEEVVITKVLPN